MRGNWPMSIDILLALMRADSKKQILHFFMSLIEDVGYTHDHFGIGDRNINTIDPENIEAVLNSQFKSE